MDETAHAEARVRIDPGGERDRQEEDARWPAVVSLSLGIFGLVTTEFLPTSMLTPMAVDLGVSAGVAGQTVTATALVAAAAAPGIVIGAAKVDRRLLVLGMSGLLVLSNMLSAVAWHISILFAARVALGIALGAFWSLCASLALRLVPFRSLPKAMSIIFTGVSVATVSGAPLGAFLGDIWGWRAMFLAASVVGIVAFAVQLLTLPPLPAIAKPGLATFRALLRRANVRVGLLTVLAAVSGHFAAFTYLRPLLEQVPRLDVHHVALLLLLFGVGGLVGNAMGSMIAARDARGSVAFSATAMALPILLLLGFGTSLDLCIVAVALWGIAFGGFPVAIQTWITRWSSDHAEGAGAMFVVVWQTAIAAGAVIGGILVDTFGPVGALAYGALALLVGALVIYAGGRDRAGTT